MTKDDYKQQYSVNTHAVDPATLNQTVLDDEKIEDALPEDPIVDDTVSEHSVENHSGSESSQPKSKSSAALAFDLLEKGGLSEATLLAALGVDDETYKPEEWIKQRALSALGLGKLTEGALLKICRARP